MKMVKITEVCDIQVGNTPSRSNPSYWGEGSKWLSIADMSQGLLLESTKETITEKAIKECRCKIIPQNTVLFSFKLSIGKVGITNVPLYTNEAIAAFVIKDKSELDTKYLFYVLKSVDHSIGSNKAVMGKTLNKEKLEKIVIPIPSLTDQKYITQILDKADSIRQKRKRSLDLSDRYLKSVFLEMFGNPMNNSKNWNLKKFADVGSLERGISKHRPRNAPELLGGNHPLIQTGDVANSGIYIKTFKSTYSDIGLKQSKKWPKGTLCITIAANIAKTGILDFEACFPDSVVGFIADKNQTNNEFIHFWISFLQEMLEKNAPESAQKNINLQILRNLEVINPPLELQNKFSEIVYKTESLKQKMLLQSQELDTQFQSLMQRSFSSN